MPICERHCEAGGFYGGRLPPSFTGLFMMPGDNVVNARRDLRERELQRYPVHSLGTTSKQVLAVVIEPGLGCDGGVCTSCWFCGHAMMRVDKDRQAGVLTSE